MNGVMARMEEAALDWVIRVRDPDFAAWEAFTLWLEQDPAHAAAYDAMAALDAGLPAMLPPAPVRLADAGVGGATPIPANDEPAVDRNAAARRRWWFAGGGAAAVAAALVAFISVPRADPYVVTTAPGQTRDIALDDGTHVTLNGGTTIRLDHADPRLAALESGEALFTVTHDAKNPFRVTVGQAVFEDVGTVFNIRRVGGTTSIGVSEGAVVYNPRAEAIALPAGRALTARDGDGTVQLSAVAPQAVGGWRSGRLVYDGAPMDEIAGDLGRSLGVTIRTAPAVSAVRFTGTVMLDRDADRFFGRAAPLLGVSARKQEGAWVLGPPDAQAK
jgi:transmembrane sensor